jgi:hypothetical protein
VQSARQELPEGGPRPHCREDRSRTAVCRGIDRLDLKPCVMLHGLCPPFMLTTLIAGFAIASSSSPIRPHDRRCGVQPSRYLAMSDLSLFMAGTGYDRCTDHARWCSAEPADPLLRT